MKKIIFCKIFALRKRIVLHGRFRNRRKKACKRRSRDLNIFHSYNLNFIFNDNELLLSWSSDFGIFICMHWNKRKISFVCARWVCTSIENYISTTRRFVPISFGIYPTLNCSTVSNNRIITVFPLSSLL